MNTSHTTKTYKRLLLICNVIVIIAAVAASVIYANNIRNTQTESRKSDFISTLESMKSLSQNYIDSERGYVEDWASYINGRQLDLEEALNFFREINTNDDRFVHIVDMDSYDAWSSYYPAGSDAIDTYHVYAGDMTEWEQSQADIMMTMYKETASKFSVLGRYQLEENLSTAISVGTRITLKVDGKLKDYLLLRVIPVEVLQKTWVFPAEYESAEVGIITGRGDYVIQSKSMKSISFPEYIRAYNFADDYNQGEYLAKKIQGSASGTLYYKDFRGDDCLWYYSSFGGSSNLDILGMINLDELNPDNSAWQIVIIICSALAILILIDGIYIHQVNLSLRRAAKLANQASEAKTQFLSSMSHDIRTPMNAVLGMMSIAKKNVDNPEYVVQCLDKSMSAGKRLLTLINDILDISKIESGQFVLTPSNISVREQIDGLISMMEHQICEKEQKFTLKMDELEYPVVFADPIRLNQIYMNLLSNAVKYTPAGGNIQLKVYEEKVEKHDDLTRLVFCVSDTGIGMTPEFQEHMYQSFSRAINTQVNRTQGSGLGLAIVQQMVDLMGGTLTCKSEVGKGTLFIVKLELPIVNDTADISQKSEDENNDVSGLHMLVAEDNDLNWEVIQVLLEEQGITCKRVENGRLCVEEFSTVPSDTYDAILMDVQMPEMTGIEACRKIRTLEDEQRRNIPIIAMTADAFAEDVQLCMDSGMNGHIAKPIDMGTLLRYLKKIKNKNI